MHIHFIAIGGSAMHNLAIALHAKGHRITGSDDKLRDPSKSRLQHHGILPPAEGWYPGRITPDIDLIILGMHARIDNPELAKARELGIPVMSYPEYLYEHSKDKTRIVIAGSHGKTTITAMVLHAFRQMHIETDYMVGAQLEGFDTMVSLSENAPYIVLEGDEYLSSPIDPRSKFLHYRPHILLISGIAWDHINVFPTYDEYLNTFRQLVSGLPAHAKLIYNAEDPEVVRLVRYAGSLVERIPYSTPPYEIRNGTTYLTGETEVPLQIFGKHNYSNMQGAAGICRATGMDERDFFDSMRSFKGASRRLEIVARSKRGVLIRDFAHAPSKVRASLKAVAEQFAGMRIIAVLELHTFSSLNKDYIRRYQGSLDEADTAAVYYDPAAVKHKDMEVISPGAIKKAFGRDDLTVLTSATELEEFINTFPPANQAVLMMSSGGFGGLDWNKLAALYG